MGSRFGYYNIPMNLEDVYISTSEFWNNNKGKILEETESEGIKTMKIQRGSSLTSNGETYLMNFKYNPRNSRTYVTYKVSLLNGFGMQWLTPSGIIRKWAKTMGVVPIDLIKKDKTKPFLDFTKPVLEPIRTPSIIKSTVKPSTRVERPKETKLELAKPEEQIKPSTIESSDWKQKLDPPELDVKDFTESEVKEYSERKIMKYCTICGAERIGTHKFCVNCGTKFSDQN
jgi:hypothetical protein